MSKSYKSSNNEIKFGKGNDRDSSYGLDLSIKVGTVYGGFAGLIAGIAFTGLILSLPTFFNFPTGVFIQALGQPIMDQISSALTLSGSDPVALGFAGFLTIIVQSVVIGITLGIISVKAKPLYISSKKRGIAIGIGTGVTAFLVLYIPVILTTYISLLSAALSNFSPTEFSFEGHSNHNLEPPSEGEYLAVMLTWGFLSYIIFGFFLGGILRWAYSVRKFDIQQQSRNT